MTLTETQARALLDFALAQVQHLLPDPLPPKPAPGQPGFRGATYHALSVLEAQRGQATNLAAREAARLARLALAHEACETLPPPENLPEGRAARSEAIQQHETESLQAGNLARQRAMLAQRLHGFYWRYFVTLTPENLALIASAYVAAIGLISWQSPARLFDSLALAALGACLGSLARYL